MVVSILFSIGSQNKATLLFLIFIFCHPISGIFQWNLSTSNIIMNSLLSPYIKELFLLFIVSALERRLKILLDLTSVKMDNHYHFHWRSIPVHWSVVWKAQWQCLSRLTKGWCQSDVLPALSLPHVRLWDRYPKHTIPAFRAFCPTTVEISRQSRV